MAKKPNQNWQINLNGRHPRVYEYGAVSELRITTMHPDLQKVCRFLIQYYNVTVLDGWRDEKNQNELYYSGKSDKKWPDSRHNVTDAQGKPCSKAVDLAIWHPERPHVHWEDMPSQVHFAGIVLGAGLALGVPLRAGCDWNENMDVTDNWIDAFHVEMKK